MSGHSFHGVFPHCNCWLTSLLCHSKHFSCIIRSSLTQSIYHFEFECTVESNQKKRSVFLFTGSPVLSSIFKLTRMLNWIFALFHTLFRHLEYSVVRVFPHNIAFWICLKPYSMRCKGNAITKMKNTSFDEETQKYEANENVKSWKTPTKMPELKNENTEDKLNLNLSRGSLCVQSSWMKNGVSVWIFLLFCLTLDPWGGEGTSGASIYMPKWYTYHSTPKQSNTIHFIVHISCDNHKWHNRVK